MKIQILFFKLVCGLASLPLIFIGLIGPRLTHKIAQNFPQIPGGLWLVVLLVYGSLILALWGLYQLQRILREVDLVGHFGQKTQQALRQIQKVASINGAAYLLSLPLFYLIAVRQATPGVMLIGLGLVVISLAIAITANLFRNLMHPAIIVEK